MSSELELNVDPLLEEVTVYSVLRDGAVTVSVRPMTDTDREEAAIEIIPSSPSPEPECLEFPSYRIPPPDATYRSIPSLLLPDEREAPGYQYVLRVPIAESILLFTGLVFFESCRLGFFEECFRKYNVNRELFRAECGDAAAQAMEIITQLKTKLDQQQ
jgi:hypothetical protein